MQVSLRRMHEALGTMSWHLQDLLQRLETPPRIIVDVDTECVTKRLSMAAPVAIRVTSVPVLPRGGGSCFKLQISSSPFVKTLLQLVQGASEIIAQELCTNN